MKPGKLFAYEILAMDFGWERYLPIDRYVAELLDSDEDDRKLNDEAKFGVAVREFYDFLDRAFEAGREKGWEGDFRQEPRVGFLPNAHGPTLFLIWKQDNNGDTFVVSPIELPYLDNAY